MVLKGTTDAALQRFAKLMDWPQHLAQKYPTRRRRQKLLWESISLGRRGIGELRTFLPNAARQRSPSGFGTQRSN